MWYNKSMSNEVLEFVVFCIENFADFIGKDAKLVYDKLKESKVLDDYIILNYDVLHTQGKNYIMNDLKEVCADRGVKF